MLSSLLGAAESLLWCRWCLDSRLTGVRKLHGICELIMDCLSACCDMRFEVAKAMPVHKALGMTVAPM